MDFHQVFITNLLKKDDIGRFLMFNQDLIILTKNDPERIAGLFFTRCQYDISRAMNRIRSAKIEIEKTNDLLDGIEDWKRENM